MFKNAALAALTITSAGQNVAAAPARFRGQAPTQNGMELSVAHYDLDFWADPKNEAQATKLYTEWKNNGVNAVYLAVGWVGWDQMVGNETEFYIPDIQPKPKRAGAKWSIREGVIQKLDKVMGHSKTKIYLQYETDDLDTRISSHKCPKASTATKLVDVLMASDELKDRVQGFSTDFEPPLQPANCADDIRKWHVQLAQSLNAQKKRYGIWIGPESIKTSTNPGDFNLKYFAEETNMDLILVMYDRGSNPPDAMPLKMYEKLVAKQLGVPDDEANGDVSGACDEECQKTFKDSTHCAALDQPAFSPVEYGNPECSAEQCSQAGSLVTLISQAPKMKVIIAAPFSASTSEWVYRRIESDYKKVNNAATLECSISGRPDEPMVNPSGFDTATTYPTCIRAHYTKATDNFIKNPAVKEQGDYVKVLLEQVTKAFSNGSDVLKKTDDGTPRLRGVYAYGSHNPEDKDRSVVCTGGVTAKGTGGYTGACEGPGACSPSLKCCKYPMLYVTEDETGSGPSKTNRIPQSSFNAYKNWLSSSPAPTPSPPAPTPSPPAPAPTPSPPAPTPSPPAPTPSPPAPAPSPAGNCTSTPFANGCACGHKWDCQSQNCAGTPNPTCQ
jgi:hypothetical protein